MTNAQAGASANEAEERLWNAATGQAWVDLQEAMDMIYRATTRRLCDQAAVALGEHVLDVGCGAGDTTMAFAAQTGPGGSVLGVDISRMLLARAEERTRASGLGNIRYLLTDAQTHDFAAGAFDILVSRFGVMFFADPVAAFRNLRTALRGTGRLCCVSWGPLARNPWFSIGRDIAVARLGKPAPSSPTATGPLAFADAEYVRGILAGAGFAAIEVVGEDVVLQADRDADWFANIAIRSGPANRIIREFSASPEDEAAIRADIARELARYATVQGVSVPAHFNFIRATQA